MIAAESKMKSRRHPDSRRRNVLKATVATTLLGAFEWPSLVAAAESEPMEIGMIGSGNVGSALGRVWARAGHQVMFSSRHLEDDKRLAAEIGAKARAGTPAEAAAFGEVLVFAVPYGALPELGESLGDSIKGKVVIDACNPFPRRDGEIAERAREKGAGLMSAELLPGARIVRAFNAIGADRMGQAHEEPGRIGMPIAGDDEEALEVASRLIREVGYKPVRVGGLDMGKYLMPGTPLAGENSPEEIRKIADTLRR
jgi:8-hydroxy-5-deazaflavin:NADPH oxidoreductase